MTLDQLVTEAMRLPANERAILAESLWESLGDPFAGEGGEEESDRLAQEREREIESGRITAITHDEMMPRLRQ